MRMILGRIALPSEPGPPQNGVQERGAGGEQCQEFCWESRSQRHVLGSSPWRRWHSEADRDSVEALPTQTQRMPTCLPIKLSIN
jgi:hypothetical protein